MYKLILLFALLSFCQGEMLDMSYLYDNMTIYPPSATQNFSYEIIHRGPLNDSKGNSFWFEFNNFCSSEHGGTHMDAPRHFSKTGWAINEIPLDRLTDVPVIVVSIKEKAAQNRSALLTAADLVAWEAKNGRIPDKSVILMTSGWGKYWGNKTAFLGGLRTEDSSFPSIAPDAAEWIVNNRPGIYGMGVDTTSMDAGTSKDFMVHRTLYNKNIYGLEHVANVDQLPIKGAFITMLPMKISGGSGAPARIFARWGKHAPLSETSTERPVNGGKATKVESIFASVFLCTMSLLFK